MEDNSILEQEVEQVEQCDKKAKYVNPVLAWGLILGEFVIAAVIAAIVILPLM